MVLSKESIQVICSLKLAKSSDEKLNQVLKSKLRRLLNADTLDVFSELHRQNELHLSLKVFEFLIGEEAVGYDTLLQLYADTILLLGRNKMVEMAEEVFSQVMEKGLKPSTGLFTEMIGVYLQVRNTEKAMEVYRSMKASGCSPNELTFTILIRNLQKKGEHELAESLKQESFDYVNVPHKFVQKVQQKHAKKEACQSFKVISGSGWGLLVLLERGIIVIDATFIVVIFCIILMIMAGSYILVIGDDVMLMGSFVPFILCDNSNNEERLFVAAYLGNQVGVCIICSCLVERNCRFSADTFRSPIRFLYKLLQLILEIKLEYLILI